MFKIIEKNRFKVLNHLVLKFRNADDEILKNYLSNRISGLKIENERVKRENIG